MSIADKLITIAENEQKVYAAGEDNTLREVWEALQMGGQRSNYTSLCNHTCWTPKTFKPIYDIEVTSGYLFGELSISDDYVETLKREGQISIKELEEEQGITFAFLGGNCDKVGVHPMFREYNFVDISTAASLNFAFYGGYLTNDRKVLLPTRIERLICSETTPFKTTTFQYAYGFEYIGFEGTIGKTLNLIHSPLIPESMKKAILCLKNFSGTGSEYTCSIKFSDECWAALEADSTAPTGTTWAEYVDSLGWNT